VVVAITRVCGPDTVGAAVGVAAAGAWLVHPAKHAARNSKIKIVEVNPTYTSLLIKIYTGIRVDKNIIQCFFLEFVKKL
jgi:hypothetical protein